MRKRIAARLVFGVMGANLASVGCAADEYSRASSKVQLSTGRTVTAGTSGSEVTGGGSAGASADLLADGGQLTPSEGGAAETQLPSAGVASGAATTGGAAASAGADAVAAAGSNGMLTGGFAGANSVGGRTSVGVAGATATPTLRDAAAARHLWMGAALASDLVNDSQYAALAAAEFNYLTPENEMKWSAIEPTQNVFSFAAADKLVTFAQDHQMRVKGHTLIWHSQLPDWVQVLNTEDAVRRAMSNHILAVAGHYKGKLLAWDVVNEAIDDATGNPLRASVFQQTLGSTYIDEAFTLARQTDPTALLFYNDYGIEGMNSKSNAAYALVARLKTSGVPIDGVGLQMHIGGSGSPTAADVIANMKRIAQLGLLVNISEMDVNLCAIAGDQSAKFAVQQQRYHDIVAACVAEPMCHGITLWGMTDKHSWLNSVAACTKTGQIGSPWALPWDTAYAKKPAWNGIMSALSGN